MRYNKCKDLTEAEKSTQISDCLRKVGFLCLRLCYDGFMMNKVLLHKDVVLNLLINKGKITMKNVLKITMLSATLALGSFGVAQAADQKIGTINVGYVMNKIPQTKAADARVNAALASKKKNLDKIQSEAQALQKVITDPNTTPEVRQQKQRDMQLLDAQFKVKQDEYVQEARKLSQKEMMDIEKKVGDAVEKVVEKEGFSMIIEARNVISLKDKSADISDKVIELVSKSK